MTVTDQAGLDIQAVQPDEEVLIARARAGDPAPWETIVQIHQQHIYRLAYLVLRDPAEAEDVAQEAFVKAFLSLNGFESGRPLRPWLTRIAVNLARNRRRSLGRSLNHLRRLVSREVEPIVDNPGPESSIQSQWLADRLWAAVQKLNKKGSEVIYLRYFLDMSEAEMAEALDVPAGTVKSRLHRALSKLEQVIGRDFPELKELFDPV